MKWALALVLAAAPFVAAANPLPGVSDAETDISSGRLEEFHLGNGDVMFVRDGTNKWFRVEFNQGCLSGSHDVRGIALRMQPGVQRITRYQTVMLDDGIARSCQIRSIRRSEVPPQIDSRSPVTLD